MKNENKLKNKTKKTKNTNTHNKWKLKRKMKNLLIFFFYASEMSAYKTDICIAFSFYFPFFLHIDFYGRIHDVSCSSKYLRFHTELSEGRIIFKIVCEWYFLFDFKSSVEEEEEACSKICNLQQTDLIFIYWSSFKHFEILKRAFQWVV